MAEARLEELEKKIGRLLAAYASSNSSSSSSSSSSSGSSPASSNASSHREAYRALGREEHERNEARSLEKTLERFARSQTQKKQLSSSEKSKLAAAQRDKLIKAQDGLADEEDFDFTSQTFKDGQTFTSAMTTRLIRRAVGQHMKTKQRSLEEAWTDLEIGKKHKVFCLPECLLDSEWRFVAACVLTGNSVEDNEVPRWIGKDGSRGEQIAAMNERIGRVVSEKIKWPQGAVDKAEKILAEKAEADALLEDAE